MELKGDFYINEIEYLAPATVHQRGKPASEIIHNNVKELVEHEQYCLIHCGTNQYLLRKDKRRLILVSSAILSCLNACRLWGEYREQNALL